MNLKNLKISTQLKIGFAAMLLFVIVLGIVSYLQTDKIHQQTEDMYNHPLVVRRTIGFLERDIYAIRVDITDSENGIPYIVGYLSGSGGGGGTDTQPIMIVAKANMPLDEHSYGVKYIDADGTEAGDLFYAYRPAGLPIAVGDIGFLGTTHDGSNVFIPANMRRQYNLPLTLQVRSSNPGDPIVGDMWFLE